MRNPPLQFIRIDLGETPARGEWTRMVTSAMKYHDMTCTYPVCVANRAVQE